MKASVVRFAILGVVLAVLSGCGVGPLVGNQWSEATDRLHGNTEMSAIMANSWHDVDRAWGYLAEGRCADALGVTDTIWGREWPGLFEDVTILRLRAFVCLGRYADAYDLLKWMDVMFPLRAEEIGAAKAFVRLALGEDVHEDVWDGMRRYPEGWLYRLLGAQLLLQEGRIRDGMEQFNLVLGGYEARGSRCAADVVNDVQHKAFQAMGHIGEKPSVGLSSNIRDGVARVGDFYGVIMDYCHGQDPAEIGGWMDAVLERLFPARSGTCGELAAARSYHKLWKQCLNDLDYDHEDPQRLLLLGELALRAGLTGKAQTVGYALLKRGEMKKEAEILLNRVHFVLYGHQNPESS